MSTRSTNWHTRLAGLRSLVSVPETGADPATPQTSTASDRGRNDVVSLTDARRLRSESGINNRLALAPNPHLNNREGGADPADPADPVALARRIRVEWERESRESIWLRFGEWRSEAVDALCSAMAERRDAAAAASRLGAARAFEGVGLCEALEDLRCGLAVGGYRAHEIDLVKELVLSWSEITLDPAGRQGWIDPLSGLVNADYLKIRLHEIYERHGESASAEYCLVLVDGHLGGSSAWGRDARDMLLGQAVRRACKTGQTKAILASGTICILERLDRTQVQRFESLREIVSEHANSSHLVKIRQPVRLWRESLPSSYGHAVALLGNFSS